MVDRNKIYAVSIGGKAPGHIAIYADADYRGFEGICYLTPPDRGHMIDGKLKYETDRGFIFKADGGTIWEFIEITYDNFKKEYHRLVEGADEILAAVSSTQELQGWYHREYPMR